MCSVSVIIPVYNTSKYLHRCLESILNQTFRDFELILINDGSTDNSLEILREYETKDSRIIVIDKPNEGVSAARNQGIEIAKGDFIMFCDSDDYVEKDWIEKLLSAIENHQKSFCVSDIYNVDINGTSKKKNKIEVQQTISMFTSFKMGLFGYIFNKIYDFDVLNKYRIRFTEGLPIGEDVEFNAKYLQYCNDIVYINDATYYYCDRETSALKKYYHDLLKYHLNCFSFRYPFIFDFELAEYCDISFGYIFPMFENVFDKRNKESFFKKLGFNQQMIKTQSFSDMISHCSEKAMDIKTRKILSKQNYYIYYLFSKLVSLKHKIFKK